MKFNYGLPTVLIGVTTVLVQPHVAVALSTSEVANIAKEITVMIEQVGRQSQGSGVIIKREGNIYTVLTAFHVVNTKSQYRIITPDGESYPLDHSNVRQFAAGVDLAVVQFNSSKNYKVAQIGDSDQVTEGTAVYVAGFPLKTSTVPVAGYRFIDGKMNGNASKPLDGGYALIYSNNTLTGMSGGPVLNEQGEVVGVHGRAETTFNPDAAGENAERIRTGFDLGILINTFVRQSAIDVGVRPPNLTLATVPKADDFYLQGGDRLDKQDYQGAIAAFSKAIELNPNYADAYNERGATRYYQGDKRGAIEDYTQTLRLNPNYATAYYNRGNARSALGDNREAIEDYNQALRLHPNYAVAYINRGIARANLGDNQGAIDDYNQAMRLSPNDALAYNYRGNARRNLGDNQSAIDDYNQAIRRNPNYVDPYNNRGIALANLGDNQGALEDYNQALRLHPKYADAYNNRGMTRANLGDIQGAINDYNQAIERNPNLALAYYNRGNALASLGQNRKSFEDLRQAASLAQQQRNTDLYQKIQNLITKLQR